MACPPPPHDYGLLTLALILGGMVGLLVGNMTKQCPPYNDEPD